MKQPVIYPIQHTELITYTVSAGLKSVSQDNIFSGLSPKLIVVGIVDNDAFNGTYKSDPFNFEHFNLTMASLYVNGDPINYKMDFTNNLSKHAYISMFQSLNILQDNSNRLTYEKWCNGNTLLVFKLSPDMTFDKEHGQPKSRPNIWLQL